MTSTLASLLLFLFAQLAIGVWVSRRIRDEGDYLIAGRQLGPVLATCSIFATWFGAETVVGSAGSVYREGVSIHSAEPYGYGLCLILMGLVFAVPLWKRRLTTLADLYRQRYGAAVERIAAVILIPSSIFWAAAQIRAFGNVLLTAGTAMDVELALAIAAGFTVLYTAFGGLLADAITDVVQGLLLTLGLCILLMAVVAAGGGVAETMNAVADAQSARAPTASGASILALIEAWAIPVCGSVVATELVGRVIASRSRGVARNAPIVAGIMYMSVGSIPVFVGLAGASMVPTLADPEHLVPAVAQSLLPGVLYAIFAGGLISAILSTVDSTLLIASGLLSHNLIVPVLRVEKEKIKVLTARAGVVGFGVLAYLLARRAEGVYALVEQASAFGSAGALVTVLFALFTRFGGPLAAATTLVSALVVYLASSFAGFAYPFLLSLLVALTAYLIVAAAERFAAPR